MPVGMGHIKQSIQSLIKTREKEVEQLHKLLDLISETEEDKGETRKQREFDRRRIDKWLDDKFSQKTREEAINSMERSRGIMMDQVNPFLNKKLTFQRAMEHIERYFNTK